MEGLVKGDVVVLPFPFSDLSSTKRRPALIISCLVGDDLIICQITTQDRDDPYAIPLKKSDFKKGSLPRESFIRPGRLLTADKAIIDRKAGSLTASKMREVEKKLVQMLTG